MDSWDWTDEDQAIANSEGWDIFDVDGEPEIEYYVDPDDCPGITHPLESDDQAIFIVEWFAARGSPTHIKALALERSNSHRQDHNYWEVPGYDG